MMRTVAERFWSKVPDQPGMDCWLWTGARDRHGYGRINYRTEDGPHRSVPAHRISYLLCVGNPQGLSVCHTCDNPPCVNPSHLFLGSQSDNMRDAISKGRRLYALREHCPHGHPYSAENTGIHKRGYRYCKACAQNATRLWKQGRKLTTQQRII